MIWIVTRHEDTVRWVLSFQELSQERVKVVPHLTDEHIKMMGPGDRVYGVLPLHLIHRVLRRGAEYYAVVLPRVPEDRRGAELSIEEIRRYGGRIWKVEDLKVEEVA